MSNKIKKPNILRQTLVIILVIDLIVLIFKSLFKKIKK